LGQYGANVFGVTIGRHYGTETCDFDEIKNSRKFIVAIPVSTGAIMTGCSS